MDIITILTGGAVIIVLLVVVLLIVILFFQIRKLQSEKASLSPVLQGIIQAIQQENTQIGVLNEKISHLEPITQSVNDIQVEMRGLGERVAKVENNQTEVSRGLGNLSNGTFSTFSELKTLTNGLSEATAAMRDELARAKNDLTELHTHAKNEQETERQIADSIHRLEAIIAGTQSKGSAGENILEVVFAKLPVEWQVRDFRIGGKTVEFGLKLPNNLIMPIDSKWTATNLLEQFLAADDLDKQQQLKRTIEEAVIQKAKEVRKYIDPSVTVNFGIAVIPDAIYDLCAGIQADAFQMNIVLVSYSMFVPYLLLVFQTVLKTCQSIDLQKLDAYLQAAQANLKELQDELDGRFSKAITMLGNSRDDMRAHLSKIGGSLTGLQMGASTVASAVLLEPENPV